MGFQVSSHPVDDGVVGGLQISRRPQIERGRRPEAQRRVNMRRAREPETSAAEEPRQATRGEVLCTTF